MSNTRSSNKLTVQLAALILLGKLAFLLFYGLTLDTDSYLYINCILHFDYPFIYPYFLYILRNFTESLYLPVLVQCLLFSVTAALLVTKITSSKQRKLIAAGLLALDPASSLLTTSILAEGIFIPFLFILLAFIFNKKKNAINATILGIVAAALYLTRFAGAAFFLIYPLILIMESVKGRYKGLLLLIPYLAGFLLLIVPVKMKYHATFGTSTLNAVSEESLWNNGAVLLPYSEIRNSPSNEFERYVFALPDSFFTTRHSIEASHIDSYSFPFHTFREQNGASFEQLPDNAENAGKTGLKLILDQPFYYLELFVWPNFKRVFVESDKTVPTVELSGYVQKNFRTAAWSEIWSWIAACGLIVLIIFNFNSKTPSNQAVVSILAVYFLALPFISPMVVRYYMILIPIALVLFIRDDKKVVDNS